jgi:hypothetical protein
MPILQNRTLNNRSSLQAGWLLERFPNVTHMAMDLTPVFTAFEKKTNPFCDAENASEVKHHGVITILTRKIERNMANYTIGLL